MSVWHRPDVSIFTRTSPGPGSGIGRSSMRSAALKSWTTAAFTTPPRADGREIPSCRRRYGSPTGRSSGRKSRQPDRRSFSERSSDGAGIEPALFRQAVARPREEPGEPRQVIATPYQHDIALLEGADRSGKCDGVAVGDDHPVEAALSRRETPEQLQAPVVPELEA